MSNQEKNNFRKNYEFDVSQYIEKKGNLDYISWAHAQRMAKEIDPNFDWCLVPNQMDDSLLHNGMVLIKMIFLNKEYKHYYPVLDYKNKAIVNPNSFDINTAQMRGMTKLFSMVSGLGLSLYTGEDLKALDEAGKQKSYIDLLNEFIKENNLDKKAICEKYALKKGSKEEDFQLVYETLKENKKIREQETKKININDLGN